MDQCGTGTQCLDRGMGGSRPPARIRRRRRPPARWRAAGEARWRAPAAEVRGVDEARGSSGQGGLGPERAPVGLAGRRRRARWKGQQGHVAGWDWPGRGGVDVSGAGRTHPAAGGGGG